MLNHVQFCDLKDCSAPCFSVPGISQARTLEWVAIPFSSGSSQPRDWTASLPLADRVLTTELSGKPCIVYIYTPGTISVQLILVFAIVKKNLLFLKTTKQCQVQFSSVQSLSYVQFFATPWTATHQASLSITNSRSLLKLMSIKSWCHPTISSSEGGSLQSFPASGSFPMSQFFASGGQSIVVSDYASVLPMNIQDWFPLGLTSLISLQSKRLSRVFSNTTVQKHQFFFFKESPHCSP